MPKITTVTHKSASFMAYFFLVALFFLGTHFLNGLGGIALLGTDRICFTAARNRANASGPSTISVVPRPVFMVSSWHKLD